MPSMNAVGNKLSSVADKFKNMNKYVKAAGLTGGAIGAGYGLYSSIRDGDGIGGGIKNTILGDITGAAIGYGLGAAGLGAYKFAQTANRMGGVGKAASMYGRFGKMKASKAFNAIKSTIKSA